MTIYDWKAQFSQQSKDYVRRTIERVAVMESLLAAINGPQSELAPMRELTQHFHQLAGSSAIYDMEQVGQQANEGEKICLNILRAESIEKSEWKRLKDILEAIKFTCLQHSAPDNEGGSALAAGARSTGSGQGAPNDLTTALSSPVAPYAVHEKPKDIMVVDGDQANMMSLTRELEKAGMHVRGYRTGDGAKSALEQRLPDALILSMPLVDGPGYDVAYHLRSLPDGQVPPVLIVSRQMGFLDKVTAIRCGADCFFNELSEPDSIVGKLKNLLERDKPQNYTILSVEDDREQAWLIQQILGSVGYKVRSLHDPVQFEEAFLSTRPDLLLLDVMLGAVSGFELAKYVRSDDRFAATPIIFLTTQNQLEAHVESARVGADEHLIKPVAPQLLIAAVAGRLERYRILKQQIGRDGLTQFLTLGSFMEAAEHMLTRRYQGHGMVMLLVDVDHMELINDRYGYAAGDRVIESLAKLLKRKLRVAELFGRIDGDGFAVLLESIDDSELAEIATELIRDFEGLAHQSNGQIFKATISAGAAMLDAEMDLKGWLGHARLALKSAKTGGRNRVMKAKPRSRR
jgi:diguanylate cyclase (GGDEF)-like protein